MPTVNQEVSLKEGLKFMLTMATVSMNLAANDSAEGFARQQDEIVDSFIKGLFNNGYKIVPLTELVADESPEA